MLCYFRIDDYYKHIEREAEPLMDFIGSVSGVIEFLFMIAAFFLGGYSEF